MSEWVAAPIHSRVHESMRGALLAQAPVYPACCHRSGHGIEETSSRLFVHNHEYGPVTRLSPPAARANTPAICALAAASVAVPYPFARACIDRSPRENLTHRDDLMLT